MTDVIEEAKSPEVFSLDKFLADAAYPTEKVTVFTDAKSANELIRLKHERELLEDSAKKQRTIATDPEDIAAPVTPELDEKIEELDKIVEQSALTFTLQGMSPSKVHEITEKYFTERNKNYSGTIEEEQRDLELIVKSVISIENADGSLSDAPITEDTIKQLEGVLLAGEYMKLIAGVAHVNLNGALFDQATDASFLGRRSNVAG